MRIEYIGTPDELITTRLDVRAYIDQKIRALQAHKTQIAQDNFVFILPEDVREQFFGYEHYMLALRAPTAHSGELEHDLFADLV